MNNIHIFIVKDLKIYMIFMLFLKQEMNKFNLKIKNL